MTSTIGLTLEFKEKSERKTDCLFHVICMLITLTALLCAVITAFNLPCRYGILSGAAVLGTALAVFVFLVQEKRKWLSLSIIFVLAVILCIIFRNELTNGFAQMFGFISETIAESENVNWNYPAFKSYNSYAVTLALSAMVVPVSLLLGYAILKRPNIFLWLFVVVPIIEPMLFFGYLPALWTFCLLLISGIMMWVLTGASVPVRKNINDGQNAKNTGVSGLLISVIIGIFLTIILLLVSRESYAQFLGGIPYRDEVKEDIKQTLSAAYEEKTPPQGGITGGDFSRADNFTFTGETALIVEADKFEGCLYLKGFTGGDYTSDGWLPADVVPDVSAEITKLDMTVLSPLFHGKERSITVTRDRAAVEGYDYTPYRVMSQDGNTFTYLSVANYDNNLFLLSRDKIYQMLLNSAGLSEGVVNAAVLDESFAKEKNVPKMPVKTIWKFRRVQKPYMMSFHNMKVLLQIEKT